MSVSRRRPSDHSVQMEGAQKDTRPLCSAVNKMSFEMHGHSYGMLFLSLPLHSQLAC
jgi:hypothetical protein